MAASFGVAEYRTAPGLVFEALWISGLYIRPVRAGGPE